MATTTEAHSLDATYAAFISYRHDADGPLATAVQRGLQRLAKPWNRRRALHVFRVETSLTAAPRLWPSIERALGRSEYFVLLASPASAGSPLGEARDPLVAGAQGARPNPARAHRWRVAVGAGSRVP